MCSTRGRRRRCSTRSSSPAPRAPGSGTRPVRRYLDFSSQLVNMNIGHQHPKLVAAIKEQADKLCTVAPMFANDVRSEAARLITELAPGRPRHGVLHERRRRGHGERRAHVPAAHRASQDPHHLPQLSRRHRWLDHPHRRSPALAERARAARRRQVLGPVPLPLGVPRRVRGPGVRAGAGAPRRGADGRGPAHRRRDHVGDGGRHQRDPGPARRLSRRASATSATSTAS